MSTIPTKIIPPAASHTHTVIFLHGRGDNTPSFSKSLYRWHGSNHRTLFEIYPSFRWVFPQAPTRKCASSPDVMPQWFDVWNVCDFADNEELQAFGLQEVVPVIRSIIHAEAVVLGGDYTKVILAGISMGAATSVHTLFNLTIPEQGGGRLGAFLGFSCRCPFAGRSLAQMRSTLALRETPEHTRVLETTPMLMEHCVDDPLVLVEDGRRLRQILCQYGATVEWKEYPVGGHWFQSPKGVDDVVQFLNRVLGAPKRINATSQCDTMDLS